MAPAKKAAKKAPAKKKAAKKAPAKKAAAKKAPAKKKAAKKAPAKKKAAPKKKAAAETPSFVTASRAKAYIKDKDLRMSSELIDALNAEVAVLLDKAAKRAELNKRGTVGPRDL